PDETLEGSPAAAAARRMLSVLSQDCGVIGGECVVYYDFGPLYGTHTTMRGYWRARFAEHPESADGSASSASSSSESSCSGSDAPVEGGRSTEGSPKLNSEFPSITSTLRSVGLARIARVIDRKSAELAAEDYSPPLPRVWELANSLRFDVAMGTLIILNCLAIAWQSAYYPKEPAGAVDDLFFV
ncbi:hypothetical protein FOZ63_012286, partial [Perkinsus olseni]